MTPAGQTLMTIYNEGEDTAIISRVYAENLANESWRYYAQCVEMEAQLRELEAEVRQMKSEMNLNNERRSAV